MKRSIALLLLALALPASAQLLYHTQVAKATNNPYYSTNLLERITSLLTGGLAATNGLPANSTNTAVWSSPILTEYFNTFDLELTGSMAAGANTNTVWIFLYPCCDGVNADTNRAISLGGYNPGTSATNLHVITNVAPLMGVNATGWYQLGLGNAGTNVFTNFLGQVWVKKVIDWTQQAP